MGWGCIGPYYAFEVGVKSVIPITGAEEEMEEGRGRMGGGLRAATRASF